jgi:preprotein translocase subunit SecA
MYDKLAGMTGTAKTQLTEFEETYKIGVIEIPTNQPNVRDDQQDLIYKTEDEKWNAVADDILERNEGGQPILVGTVSIEKSEHLSGVLTRRGIPHNVLNAKNHEKEAQIVAQAGRLGAVTVATNMAGRGVDILLGGNAEYLARQEMAANEWDNDKYLLFEMEPEERKAYEAAYAPILEKFKAQADAEHEEVVGSGGLYVLGTERHESRRIDNQLRGRSGRQGDPGASLFYLSLEDDLMRMFASDTVANIMERLKWPEGEPIEAKMVTKAVERAQRQIEELNYERRKNVLKYDEVMNGQREVIYGERRKILEGHDLKEQAQDFIREVVAEVIAAWCPPDVYPEDWDREGLIAALREVFPFEASPNDLAELEDVAALTERCEQEALEAYERKEAAVGADVMRELERVVLLNITDTKWREHLYEMDYLQEGIHLRAYAQRDPLTEYRREAFEMFEALTQSIREDFVKYIYRVELVRQEQQQPARVQRVQENSDEVASGAGGAGEAPQGMGKRVGGNANQAISDKVPRNAPCPCGSGKKYKKCHGAAVPA